MEVCDVIAKVWLIGRSDVFYGRGQKILDQREKIKLASLAMRRKMHYDNQAGQLTQMS